MRTNRRRGSFLGRGFLFIACVALIFSLICSAEVFAEPVEPPLEEGFYLISEPGHLEWFRDKVNSGDVTANARLVRDIDLQGVEWKQIGPVLGPTVDNRFNGIFDGNGKSILNLSVGDWAIPGEFGEVNGGLFGYVGASGDVHDLTVKDAVIAVSSSRSYANAGIIAGTNEGVIRGCSASGSVEAECTVDWDAYAGGIAGYNRGGRIIGCVADVDLEAVIPGDAQWSSACAGGIVGNVYTGGADAPLDAVTDCVVSGGSVAAQGAEIFVGAVAGSLFQDYLIRGCWFDETLANGVGVGQIAGVAADAQTTAFDSGGDLSTLPIVTIFFEKNAIELDAGTQETLRAVTQPGTNGTLNWSVESEDIAGVVPAADGLSAEIRGKAEGATVILCTLAGADGKTIRCDLTVLAGKDDPSTPDTPSGKSSSNCSTNTAGVLLALCVAPLFYLRRK